MASSIFVLLTLYLSLHLSVLEAELNTLPPPLFSSQLRSKLLILLLGKAQSLAGLCVKIVREPRLILGIFHPLFGHKYLLDGLHKKGKGMLYQIRKR